jgi:prevent-host-death family protein
MVTKVRPMREVQLRDAKAAFSAVVESAAQGEETLVTRHGQPMAVVLGYAEWQRLKGTRPGFAEALLDFPEIGEIERDPTPVRDLARDLGR